MEEEKCIVTINGKKYDMSEFRKRHPGGDLFANEKDMTTTFYGHHGQDTKRLSEFEIGSTAIDSHRKEAKVVVDLKEDLSPHPEKSYSIKDLDKVLAEELDDI